MKSSNFNNRYNKLINECYDTIAEIVKKHSTESYYDSVQKITIYTLSIKYQTSPSELFISWINGDGDVFQDMITKIEYFDYGYMSEINFTDIIGNEFSITSCLGADICELTDYLIERYG